METELFENKILEQYYRGYISVDLDNIVHNIRAMKQNLRQGIKMAAVVKTDGYGHGAVPIADVIEDDVDAFAVATIAEGINLRKHGIEKPIYLLGFLPEARIEDAITHEIRQAVFQYSTAETISRKSMEMRKKAKIHIKVDTGMGRIGFLCKEEYVQQVLAIGKLPGIEVEGIFTHFASSDSADKKMAKEQYEKFKWFITRLEEEGMQIPIKHCDNSAGIIDLPEDSLDLVRAGIALYGLYPSEEVNKDAVKLKPALSLKSHIIYLKELEAGCGVSYGSTYITERPTKIATIPLGYGDGYQRNLSNKGYVLIRGQQAPIIGRVCMDQFMVDVTEIDGVQEGDEVTLIGCDGQMQITVEELAALAGTFNYEFVCDLGKRIPRIYYKNGSIIWKKDYFFDLYEYIGK